MTWVNNVKGGGARSVKLGIDGCIPAEYYPSILYESGVFVLTSREARKEANDT